MFEPKPDLPSQRNMKGTAPLDRNLQKIMHYSTNTAKKNWIYHHPHQQRPSGEPRH